MYKLIIHLRDDGGDSVTLILYMKSTETPKVFAEFIMSAIGEAGAHGVIALGYVAWPGVSVSSGQMVIMTREIRAINITEIESNDE